MKFRTFASSDEAASTAGLGINPTRWDWESLGRRVTRAAAIAAAMHMEESAAAGLGEASMSLRRQEAAGT